ncbi:hypothetical protein F5Y01DRAFT_288730 [Xylaria sp. FL0043]|nr:hypothetical protein F5Y01DRAFT_288730 [Xylaria sp. FL0043]
MAKFLAALLAAAALFQVGMAAPYHTPTNTTVEIKAARHYNYTFTPEIHRREIRTYPVALQRP